MIFALYTFGENSYAIWEFAGGVIVVMLVIALVTMGIAFIKRLVEG